MIPVLPDFFMAFWGVYQQKIENELFKAVVGFIKAAFAKCIIQWIQGDSRNKISFEVFNWKSSNEVLSQTLSVSVCITSLGKHKRLASASDKIVVLVLPQRWAWKESFHSWHQVHEDQINKTKHDSSLIPSSLVREILFRNFNSGQTLCWTSKSHSSTSYFTTPLTVARTVSASEK